VPTSPICRWSRRFDPQASSTFSGGRPCPSRQVDSQGQEAYAGSGPEKGDFLGPIPLNCSKRPRPHLSGRGFSYAIEITAASARPAPAETPKLSRLIMAQAAERPRGGPRASDYKFFAAWQRRKTMQQHPLPALPGILPHSSTSSDCDGNEGSRPLGCESGGLFVDKFGDAPALIIAHAYRDR